VPEGGSGGLKYKDIYEASYVEVRCYHVLHLPVVAAVAEVPGRGLADDDPVRLLLNY
jgi:hypothetical protein